MTQNNEILDKLIQNNDAVWTVLDENIEDDTNKVPTGTDDEVLITTSRVVWVRYKVYSIILLLLIFVLWYSYILPSYDNHEYTKSSILTLELQMLNFENTKLKYDGNKWLVDKIKQVEPQVITCVNTLKWCNALPVQVKNNFGIVRSYLLLHEMSWDKMDVDEKAIFGPRRVRGKRGVWSW